MPKGVEVAVDVPVVTAPLILMPVLVPATSKAKVASTVAETMTVSSIAIMTLDFSITVPPGVSVLKEIPCEVFVLGLVILLMAKNCAPEEIGPLAVQIASSPLTEAELPAGQLIFPEFKFENPEEKVIMILSPFDNELFKTK